MDDGDGEDSESVATEDDPATATTVGGDTEPLLTDGEKTDHSDIESLAPTPEPDTVIEAPIVEEPQPPSPAPEELWEYLKGAVTSESVVTVDELVEKLVSTVSTIPQPYLKSVVKESIKKQKSIEEEEGPHEVPSTENATDGVQSTEVPLQEGDIVTGTAETDKPLEESTEATAPAPSAESATTPATDGAPAEETATASQEPPVADPPQQTEGIPTVEASPVTEPVAEPVPASA